MTAEPGRGAARRLAHVERRLAALEAAVAAAGRAGSGPDAEAYDGLRRAVVAAASERTAHVAQLAELHELLAAGIDGATLAVLARGWLDQGGVRVVTEVGPDGPGARFEGEGTTVVRPAYVDERTGRVVRQGRVVVDGNDREAG